MRISLLEPFFTGSHAAWAEEYARYSRHDIELLTLRGRHWKWRMHGGAVTLAKKFLQSNFAPDFLLATDMLDLTTFLALTREKTANKKTAIYFHENQLTYPWSPNDTDPAKRRDAHYAFINYASALAADSVLFNSQYHKKSFQKQLPEFLKSFPDHNELDTLKPLQEKSDVLPLGLDLKQLENYRPDEKEDSSREPIILWNHRWEYDKNPEEFFQALYTLQDEGLDFKVVLLGESYWQHPPAFVEAHKRLGTRILQFGYADNFADYARWLWQADILPVTSHHDFFGASVVQAIYCECSPILPRRLAYPEHVAQELHEVYLYDNFDELVEKLRQRVLTVDENRDTLSKRVVQYDWSVLVKQYDDLFQKLCEINPEDS
jgi:glycosyltransferase involved in cell wall biosynthesis